MRKILIVLLSLTMTYMPMGAYAGVNSANCHGQFPNLVSDVCWDCAFPITLFGVPMMSPGQQEDYDTGVPNLCTCPGPAGVPIAGLHTSFWEFTRQVDVTRTPYCMVSLGTEMDMGVNDTLLGSDTPGSETVDGSHMHTSFRQVHWYVDPAMGLMGLMLDSKCLENDPFDIAYLSEVDPTHSDEELSRIMAPEEYLFGNIVAQTACAVDCVQSSLGFGNNLLFWCSGCNGSIYPFDGFVTPVYGGVQMSSVMVHRITAKLHRMMTQFSTAGVQGMCGQGQIQVTMDKREYKYSMLYPVSQSSGDTSVYSGSGPILDTAGSNNGSQASQAQQSNYGRCCQPYGRTTILWGAGRELPTPGGQDFAYAIFRKRDCCQ